MSGRPAASPIWRAPGAFVSTAALSLPPVGLIARGKSWRVCGRLAEHLAPTKADPNSLRRRPLLRFLGTQKLTNIREQQEEEEAKLGHVTFLGRRRKIAGAGSINNVSRATDSHFSFSWVSFLKSGTGATPRSLALGLNRAQQ